MKIDSIVKGIAGSILLLSLLITKLFTYATPQSTWILNYKTNINCWFGESFNSPGPLCGMTRSFIMTLQGEISSALGLHFIGPFLVFGILIFSVVLLYSALRPPYKNKVFNEGVENKLLAFISIYFCLITIASVVFSIYRVWSAV